jgi:hypothetical protein
MECNEINRVILKMTFQKNGIAWNKGIPATEETRLKQRLVKLKNPSPNSFKKGTSREHIARLFRGKPISESSILKRTISRYGNFWWYGNVKYEEDGLYCERFDEPFKERVRAYWGYKCFECDAPQNGRKLAVHHVHYDKKMCCNGSPRDVVPLCWDCHMASNNHRDYWEDHFTQLLYLYHPNGKCYFTREEMERYSNLLKVGA